MSEAADLDALAARASDATVIVVGGGIGGLVAALECAKVGLRVTVLEAADAVGGVVRGADVGGLRLDVGAESFATRGGTVGALLDELGLAGDVVRPNPAGAWVTGLPGGRAAPLPRGGILGIPDNPWAPDVRRVIGWGGAWRAYLDRLRPPLTIGHQHSLGKLVRTRMGARVLERLVAPVTSGVYSARPDDIDVDAAAPGLNAALTRTGSLSGAVSELRGGRAQTPGAAVSGISGGMWRLADALAARLSELGADVRTGVTATALDRTAHGWRVATDADAEAQTADAVIVALPEAPAHALLHAAVPTLAREPGEGPVVEVVTLVVDAAVLDAHPRGSGVLAVPGSSAAKALTHSSAKWDWVAAAAGAGVHVVRVSFGAQGEAPATASLSDEDAAALGLAQAATLLGVELPASALRAARRDRYVQSQPAAAIGQAARSAEARRAIAAVPALGAVGAWLSGTGLAQVVPDARREADRLRRSLLWGTSDGSPTR